MSSVNFASAGFTIYSKTPSALRQYLNFTLERLGNILDVNFQNN